MSIDQTPPVKYPVGTRVRHALMSDGDGGAVVIALDRTTHANGLLYVVRFDDTSEASYAAGDLRDFHPTPAEAARLAAEAQRDEYAALLRLAQFDDGTDLDDGDLEVACALLDYADGAAFDDGRPVGELEERVREAVEPLSVEVDVRLSLAEYASAEYAEEVDARAVVNGVRAYRVLLGCGGPTTDWTYDVDRAEVTYGTSATGGRNWEYRSHTLHGADALPFVGVLRLLGVESL